MKIRIGSRDSKLAMIQTNMVADAIRKYDASIEIEIVSMKTTGDKILDRTLDKIGGKGLFVKELDDALLSGAVDITVHSYKDMPMQINENLPVVAVSSREDARDVLILREGICDISQVKIVGTSSQRRKLQLEKLGEYDIKPIRGNLQTRLSKLDSGEYDAIVLAAAGVLRSGLGGRVSKYFSTDEIIPAACQGIIAVQARARQDVSFLYGFNCEESVICSNIERAFVEALDGGCSSPIACYATLENDKVNICAMYADENTICTEKITSDKMNARAEAVKLAKSFLLRGNI